MVPRREDVDELLETLAFQEAAGTALPGLRHGSRVAKLPVGSWQGKVIQESSGVALARTPTEMRAQMKVSDVAVVFLPHDALLTAEAIDNICIESPHDKLVVWETDA